jgi:hypothetical protein
VNTIKLTHFNLGGMGEIEANNTSEKWLPFRSKSSPLSSTMYERNEKTNYQLLFVHLDNDVSISVHSHEPFGKKPI